MGTKQRIKMFLIFVIVYTAIVAMVVAFYKIPSQPQKRHQYSARYFNRTRLPSYQHDFMLKEISLKHKKLYGRKTEKMFKIAFYHPFHSGMKGHKKNLDMLFCKYSNCDVFFTKSTPGVIDADAVLFQGNHIPPVVPTRRDNNQVFVFAAVEAPQYLNRMHLDKPRWTGFFNWTMTYRLESDIPYLYGLVVQKNNSTNYFPKFMGGSQNLLTSEDVETESVSKNYTEIFLRKSKSAVWLVSHCKTASHRELYVQRMQKHLNIDVFGACSDNKFKCPRNSAQCDYSITEKYKFYLAFENSLCEDYITEKAYKWYTKDIVLIVRGARFYDRLLPVGTYINTDDFNTPEELARFLSELGNDDYKYTQILRRKDRYSIISEQQCAQKAYCDLCERLNNLEKFRKTIKSINHWWLEGMCTHPSDL